MSALLVVLLLHRGCQLAEADWYRSCMPASLEAGEVVLINSASGFREGCGAAIFRLSDAVRKRIEEEGVDFLGEGWRETPYLPGGGTADSWMTGMSEGCGHLPEEMDSQVDAALRAPGAFYSLGHEKGYIVIPRLGWAILSFNG
ncbi:hypothetical protein [Mitsuaria sp. 7]|uniref:hypothetical protein n=1 Tax=Mitsuaria sp. 7 TaxID=1658665 RepID=UPI0012F83EE1|nr:hypothetical protein [Mitsuaria sp. 7]